MMRQTLSEFAGCKDWDVEELCRFIDALYDWGRRGRMSEQDTREQLEADIERLIEDAMSYGWEQQPRISADAIELLNRQAAITERECMERATSERVGWDCAECAEGLHKRVDELTADAKRWADAANGQRLVAMEQADKVQEITAERDELQAAIDAMENGQMYAMYAAMRIERNDLRAEVENLRKRNDNQADTIRKLRAEFDAALDDLARAVEDKRPHTF